MPPYRTITSNEEPLLSPIATISAYQSRVFSSLFTRPPAKVSYRAAISSKYRKLEINLT